MAEYAIISKALLKRIGNAIRKMRGITNSIAATDMPEEIESIETGSDVSGVTATAADVLSPKVFVNSDGDEVTGSIATKSSSDISTSGATVTVPAGYYSSQATKSIATVSKATPTISVSSSGVISASYNQSAGYVTSGMVSAPTITLSSSYDSDFVSSNIKYGVSIFGLQGDLKTAKVVTDEFISIYSSGTNLIINLSSKLSSFDSVLCIGLSFYGYVNGQVYHIAAHLVSNNKIEFVVEKAAQVCNYAIVGATLNIAYGIQITDISGINGSIVVE